MKIPIEELSDDALRGVVESFVLREGTDYGADYTLDQKCASVLEALRNGHAQLVYDPQTESIDIQPAE